jgi:hypothetical protein
VLLHEVRLFDADAPGTFFGVKSGPAGGMQLKDLVPGSDLFNARWNFFKCPHTTACVRIPEATGLLPGLYVARRSERYREGDGEAWHRRHLDDLGIEGWAAVIRKRADPDVAEKVLAGPVRGVLADERVHGFTIEFMYGQLMVYQQHFLEDAAELDAFCEVVSRIAREIRNICTPRLDSQPFHVELPPPDWLPFVAQRLDERHILAPQGVWLERIAQIAGERGMAVEDPHSFHVAFPLLPVPGEAFGVLRGDGIRMLSLLERSIEDISAIKDAFADPGGPVGADAVVLPAPGRPDTDDGVDGTRCDFGRFAVRGEQLVAWRARDAWQATGEPLDALAAQARSLL